MTLERQEIADAVKEGGVTQGPLKAIWDEVVQASSNFPDVEALLENNNVDLTVKLATFYNSLCDNVEGLEENGALSEEIREKRRQVIESVVKQSGVAEEKRFGMYSVADAFVNRVQIVALTHIAREQAQEIKAGTSQPKAGLR